MIEHTPEPWRVTGEDYPAVVIPKDSLNAIAYCCTYGIPREIEEMKANARRIVSCVNGCAGVMRPDFIPSAIGYMRTLSLDKHMPPEIVSRLSQILTSLDLEPKE